MRDTLVAVLLLIAAVLLSIAVGSVFIPPATIVRLILPDSFLPQWVIAGTATFETIVFQLRIPRTVLVLLTGAALAGSGAAYQGTFRNPLADPYLIGVASGAGLGAVIAMGIHFPNTFAGMAPIPAAAFAGGLLTVLVVYFLARVGKTVPVTNLILAGVAVSSFTTAMNSFLLLRAEGELKRALSWLLGGSTQTGWSPVLAALPYILISLGFLLFMGHQLNVLQFGDEQAQQLGLPVERVRLTIIIAASLATAAAVAFSGIIGFIGLIVPHTVRFLCGPDYRKLIPLSILGGASALLFADVLSRVVLAPQEIPVGVVTAICGAPFFLWILRRSQTGSAW